MKILRTLSLLTTVCLTALYALAHGADNKRAFMANTPHADNQPKTRHTAPPILPHMSHPLSPATASVSATPSLTSPQPLLRILTPGSEGGHQALPGPFPQTQGVAPCPQATTVEIPLQATGMLERGSLTAWIYLPEALLSGPNNTSWRETIVSAPGVLDISISMSPQFFGLYFNWRGDQKDGGNVRCLIPGLPGPGWHHIAVVWDIPAGFHNLYLNGCPTHIGQNRYWDDLPAPKLTSLHLNAKRTGLWNVQLFDRTLTQEDIENQLTPLYYGSSDFIMGARPLGKMTVDLSRLPLLYENPLTLAPDNNDWILEGPGLLDFTSDGLTMRSAEPEGQMGHFVYWLDLQLPESFVAQWEVTILSEYGLNIVFFSASGPGGESIFSPELAPRDGDFRQYHSGDFNCYHISYYADTPNEPGRSTTNLRKNSGFYLVANGPSGIAGDSTDTHTVTLLKEGSRIRLAVDDQLCIDWTDDGSHYGPTLGAGWFGLRQMQWTVARYRNLSIHALK